MTKTIIKVRTKSYFDPNRMVAEVSSRSTLVFAPIHVFTLFQNIFDTGQSIKRCSLVSGLLLQNVQSSSYLLLFDFFSRSYIFVAKIFWLIRYWNHFYLMSVDNVKFKAQTSFQSSLSILNSVCHIFFDCFIFWSYQGIVKQCATFPLFKKRIHVIRTKRHSYNSPFKSFKLKFVW